MPSAVISFKCTTDGTMVCAPSTPFNVDPTIDIPVFGISLGAFTFIVVYFDVRARLLPFHGSIYSS
jgi:hypothetical protein